jgi:glycine C-acetyltransferase
MRFLILTAIEEEYIQARSYLQEIKEVEAQDGTIIEEGFFLYDDSRIIISLVKTGMGNIKSGIVSHIALNKIKPDYLLFVGIAGGIKDVEIGDVLVGEKFYYYENGKVKDQFYARPESGNSAYRILQRATIESRKDDWKNACKQMCPTKSKVVIGNIASGEKVVAAQDSSTFSPYTIIKQHYNDAHAIDMESGGLITSSWVSSYPNLVVIRGISDLLVNKEESDSAGCRTWAINNAFGFAFHLIKKIYDSDKAKTACTITFNADESILQEPYFTDAITALRKISEDASLSFRFSTTGSIVFHLYCKKEGYEKLKLLFDANFLNSLEGFKILDIQREGQNEFFKNTQSDLKISNDDQYDIFHRLMKHYDPISKHRERSHGYFAFPKLEGAIGSRMRFRGKEMIIWSISNYLGIANNPEVNEAEKHALKEFGLSSPMGARMLSGNTSFHEQLESELAAFEGKEDALILNYGYQGMVSLIDVLCGRHDVIIYDAESHACIIDGLRIHPGHRYVFKHNDIEDLENQLKRASELIKKNKSGGILVITEGVFGMAGDQGKLRQIVLLKQQYSFRLLVNDSHGFGILGADGSGIGDELNVNEDIDLYFASFSKAVSSIGAFVAGDKNIIDYIRYNIRSQIFSKSLPVTIIISNLKRLEIIRTHHEFRQKLWANVSKLQNTLKQNGFDIGQTDSHITPIYLKGSVEEATAMTMDLRENYNIFCSIVVYPVIPKGRIIYRLIVTSAHTDDDINDTLNAFIETKKKLDSGLYKPHGVGELISVDN